jgi:hypothetical protein
MRKIPKVLTVLTAGFLSFFVVMGGLCFLLNSPLGEIEKVSAANSDTVTLDVDITEYIDVSITSGDTVDFGAVSPLALTKGPATGTVVSVTTSAANGYSLGISDGVAGSDSAFLHTGDSTTRIPDNEGTIETPLAWTGNGLGITLYAGDSTVDPKWCANGQTCTTYDDADNLFAGVPQAVTPAHVVTGYHAGADTSTWAFGLRVANSQKTGSYNGTVTFSGTPVLN